MYMSMAKVPYGVIEGKAPLEILCQIEMSREMYLNDGVRVLYILYTLYMIIIIMYNVYNI